ncbi:hypothetical protein K2173_009233 [Erythroxylum novogranatense]|uniref:Sialate O-acetylesterase domain-containing protein n=1 Tax=Erythroxylum novogranatense TaxID=1862640 RepID=A0AAV8TLR3_9ROSI|nr:hypothetical protein K2173_009233 [Erythroxylum novogranatense]
MDEMIKPNKNIFILSGQSNMAGRGGMVKIYDHHHYHKKWDGVVPPECQPHTDILRFSAKLEWEQARAPLHYDIDAKKMCGVGPGMPFSNRARKVGGVVGLVPCAVGGTAIKEWERGEELYENMVRRAKESAKDGGGQIKCLLWFQGESDTSSLKDAEAYQEKMVKLVHDVREDLGLPSLPIIQVAIASGNEYMGKVREAQLGMKLPNVVCVDAKGLQLQEDNLHLTTESQVKLGHMLADAYLTHFSSPSSSSSF